eukprot:scaffold2796_cov158-Skeletonema_dohrnii-CCMP3373.AAC.1
MFSRRTYLLLSALPPAAPPHAPPPLVTSRSSSSSVYLLLVACSIGRILWCFETYIFCCYAGLIMFDFP